MLIHNDPAQKHSEVNVLLGETGFQWDAMQRDLDNSGRVPPDTDFLIGSHQGATAIYEIRRGGANRALLEGVRPHEPPSAPIAEPDPQIERFEAAAPPDGAALGQSAARGVSLLVGRTLGFQLLTAGVTVVLARLLSPADYGLFAIALSVQLVGQNIAELGLPAALVRMQETPSAELQRATIGFLLAVTSTIVLMALLLTFTILPALDASSRVLQVIATTLVALPIYAARAVPMAMFDRELRFGRVAAVEAADTVGFNLFALGAALAGLGVFSLAGAVPIGAVLGAGVAWALPVGSPPTAVRAVASKAADRLWQPSERPRCPLPRSRPWLRGPRSAPSAVRRWPASTRWPSGFSRFRPPLRPPSPG